MLPRSEDDLIDCLSYRRNKRSLDFMFRLRFIFFCAFAGIIVWGAPAAILFPSELGVLFASCVLGLFLGGVHLSGPLIRQWSGEENLPSRKFPEFLLFACLVFLIIDVSVGRQVYSANLFISAGSVDQIVESQNDQRGTGRGVFGLLGSIFLIAPFILMDFSKRRALLSKCLFIFLALALIFNEMQASRGYVLVSVLALAMASPRIHLSKLLIAAISGISFFLLSSWYRGDFERLTGANPLIDAAAWPFVNLAMLINSDCGSASVLEFIAEIAQKVIPSFVFQKTIFSFNVEASECIYGLSLDELGAVSVFTYMGELSYYQPGWIAGFISCWLLGFASRKLDDFFVANRLFATQSFVGFWFIVILRSRVLDVFSIIISIIIFIALIKFCSRQYAGRIIPTSSVVLD